MPRIRDDAAGKMEGRETVLISVQSFVFIKRINEKERKNNRESERIILLDLLFSRA